jgi:glutaredoxin
MTAAAGRFRPTEARVVMLTRTSCHLCEAALTVIEQVCAETGSSYATRDVDADPDLRAQYTDQVPVTFVDGRQHDFWTVDAGRLRAALSRDRLR